MPGSGRMRLAGRVGEPMMTLLLTEADIGRVLTMPIAIEAVEGAMRAGGSGSAVNRARERVRTRGGTLHLMGAALPSAGVTGMKCYLTTPRGAQFHVLLYSLVTGKLRAMIEADR